jgi:hypothetical protein
MEEKDQKYEPLDLTSVLEGYEDKWVVISEDYSEVIVSGNNFEDIKDSIYRGIVMLVPNPKFIFTPVYNQ